MLGFVGLRNGGRCFVLVFVVICWDVMFVECVKVSKWDVGMFLCGVVLDIMVCLWECEGVFFLWWYGLGVVLFLVVLMSSLSFVIVFIKIML